MFLKRILKSFTPPVILNLLRWLNRKNTVFFVGVYPNWEAATKDSTGYDSGTILEQIVATTRLVASDNAAYERDGVIFDKITYPYPLLALLLRAASENNNQLTVLDFGGSLGSTYYQCRSFLQGVSGLKWYVVEQSHFVEAGNTYFADGILSFYNTIADSLKCGQPNVVLFSGVLQYLPEPFIVLEEAIGTKAEYVVIDRNPFIAKGVTLLSLQKVPKGIVNSSYPVWLFNESELKHVFAGRYLEITAFDAIDGTLGWGPLKANFKGLAYKRITEKGNI